MEIDPEAIQEELKTFTVELVPDPALQQIGDLFAKVQGYRERVSYILGCVRMAKMQTEFQFDIAFAEKFQKISQDGSKKTLDEKKSICILELKEEKGNVVVLEALEEIVKLKLQQLISANENVSRQLSVVQEQLRLGERTK